MIKKENKPSQSMVVGCRHKAPEGAGERRKELRKK
jgi:hypothetical protein